MSVDSRESVWPKIYMGLFSGEMERAFGTDRNRYIVANRNLALASCAFALAEGAPLAVFGFVHYMTTIPPGVYDLHSSTTPEQWIAKTRVNYNLLRPQPMPPHINHVLSRLSMGDMYYQDIGRLPPE